MVVGLSTERDLLGPDIAHFAVMRILVRPSGHVSIMVDLGFERLDKLADDFIGVGIIW